MIVISPLKATLNPSSADDQIIEGIQLSVDPNGQILTVGRGRVRLNSVYMDLTQAIETDLTAAPMGRSLMALDTTLTLRFLDDNSGEYLVLGVLDKRIVGAAVHINIVPVVYILAGVHYSSVVSDVFAPTVSVETQLRMLFEELAVNKMRDAELKYEEILESLPDEFNALFIENFRDTAFFQSNQLAYNPHSKTVSLGLVAPYVVNTNKTLVERTTLPNAITRAYFALDAVSNDATYEVRLSFDGGATWAAYVRDDFYTLASGNQLVVEIKLSTTSSLKSPVVRSWALFYNKAS